jgi:hypothetical protein
MAVHKAIRTNPATQPQRRRPDPQLKALQLRDAHPKDPQLKSELFEALRHLNRGFGVALSSLDNLQRKDRQPGIFPRDLLLSYRNRTEELRALANRDLLHWIAGNEEQEAERFGLLCGSRKRSRRS